MNLPSSTLTIENSDVVSVAMRNNGTMVIGASPGIASADSFAQTSAGSLSIELGGTDLFISYAGSSVNDVPCR